MRSTTRSTCFSTPRSGSSQRRTRPVAGLGPGSGRQRRGKCRRPCTGTVARSRVLTAALTPVASLGVPLEVSLNPLDRGAKLLRSPAGGPSARLDHHPKESRMAKHIQIESTAEAYLEMLAARGVEYLFANAGTDFAPLIEAYAKRGAQGQALPRPITVPHEVPAIAMAHGYAMVTGRAQAVMVHVIVGAANALGGVINAARAQVPILFSAGRTPLSEGGLPGSRDRHIHWAQEAYDQAGMAREFVKWDYELRNFSQIETVVDRALLMAQAEPPGPVYLT